LFWEKTTAKQVKVGEEAKSIDSRGYKIVRFKGRLYQTHRVIWFLVNKEQPPKVLDHINNDRLDNHIENLREVTYSQNSHNAKIRTDNKSGVKGVHWNKKNNNWVVQVRANNKNQHIGSFTNLTEAEHAVKNARKTLHGEYANHG
jgi:hypothetical protein